MGKLFKERQNEIPVEKIVRELLNDGRFFNEDSRGELWCKCPLHDERTPSFSINIRSDSKRYGLFNCFACGGGDICQLVKEIKNFSSYHEAETWIEDNYLELSDEWSSESLLKKISELSMIEKSHSLTEEEKMPEYEYLFPFVTHPWMYTQGLTDEAIKHFQITYDPKEEVIIFPHWWKGKLVGWQSRDLTGERKAKYLNTSNFPKRNTLFNYDNLTWEKPVIVVESPKTAAVLWGRGIHNVTATFGASLSEEQMVSLWSFPLVYLWFDNDDPGRKATRTAIQYLKDNTEVYVIPPVDIEKGDAADIPSSELDGYLDRVKYYIYWE